MEESKTEEDSTKEREKKLTDYMKVEGDERERGGRCLRQSH